jgi:hypothetical protein
MHNIGKVTAMQLHDVSHSITGLSALHEPSTSCYHVVQCALGCSENVLLHVGQHPPDMLMHGIMESVIVCAAHITHKTSVEQQIADLQLVGRGLMHNGPPDVAPFAMRKRLFGKLHRQCIVLACVLGPMRSRHPAWVYAGLGAVRFCPLASAAALCCAASERPPVAPFSLFTLQ